MSPDTINVVTPDDGQGDEKVTIENTTGDMDVDIAEQALEEGALAHTALMTESRGNAQSSHSLVRHAGARKFNQEDPIEAAAVEMILQKNAP